MLVSVPTLCTTMLFVYISSLIFPRVPTPFVPEAGVCSLSAPFSPFTHTPKLASCYVLPSWLEGGQTSTTAKKQIKKRPPRKIFCQPLPLTHCKAPKDPPALSSILAFSIHIPALCSPHHAPHHRCADLCWLAGCAPHRGDTVISKIPCAHSSCDVKPANHWY